MTDHGRAGAEKHGSNRSGAGLTTHEAEEDSRNADILIHVNGRLVPRKEAVVSVYDSGFLLGDGMWEGLRLYNGRWAFLEDHLDRLFKFRSDAIQEI